MLVIAFCLWLGYITNYYNTQLFTVVEKPEQTPDFMFENITISHIYNGELEFEMKSEKAVIYEDDNRILLENPKGTLLESDKGLLVFESPNASYDLKSNELILDETYMAYVLNNRALWIYSDQLEWNPRELEAHTSGFSFINSDDMYVESNHIVFDLENNELSLERKPVLRLFQ